MAGSYFELYSALQESCVVGWMKEAERGVVKVEKKKKKKTRINLFIRHILLPPFEDPACFLSRASSFSRFYSLDRVLSSFFIRYALPPVQFSPQLESFTLLFLTPASQKSFYTEDSTGSIKEEK